MSCLNLFMYIDLVVIEIGMIWGHDYLFVFRNVVFFLFYTTLNQKHRGI